VLYSYDAQERSEPRCSSVPSSCKTERARDCGVGVAVAGASMADLIGAGSSSARARARSDAVCHWAFVRARLSLVAASRSRTAGAPSGHGGSPGGPGPLVVLWVWVMVVRTPELQVPSGSRQRRGIGTAGHSGEPGTGAFCILARLRNLEFRVQLSTVVPVKIDYWVNLLEGSRLLECWVTRLQRQAILLKLNAKYRYPYRTECEPTASNSAQSQTFQGLFRRYILTGKHILGNKKKL
jgi:hypothetical protein